MTTTRLEVPFQAAESFLDDGGEVGALMRSVDWSKTPLGPIAGWPQSLRTSASICLSSRFPIVLFWGPELALIYNDAYLPILSGKHPRAIGRPGLEVWSEIGEVITPMLRGVMETGKATWSEDLMLPLARLEGGRPEESYFTFTYSPIRIESGTVGGVFCAVVETTERVIEERRLRLLNALAGATQSSTPAEACKQAAEHITRFPSDVPFALFYLRDDGSLDLRLTAAANVEEGTPRSPLVIANAHPSPWPFGQKTTSVVELDEPIAGARCATVLPIERSGGGQLFGFLVVGMSAMLRRGGPYARFHTLLSASISQAASHAAAREEERARVQALAEIDRAKTMFFSNVSHEFRTPLTLMLGPIEDMRALGPRDPAEAERIDLLHRNALRLLKLVNTLLDFSRIEAGRAEAAYEPTDLAALTADLASSFRSAVERAGLTLVVDCPPLSEAIYVDHDMWEKIVLNLLSNAFKFTFEGTIAVRLREVDGGAELEVADSGIGIAERDLPRLFDRFHRVEGVRSRSHEGSGIGLALVQELVLFHSGELRVKSRPGEGTSFTLRIPYGTAHLPKDRLRAARSLQGSTVGAGAYVQEALRWVSTDDKHFTPPFVADRTGNELRERIVVADDNADMRDYLTRLLRERWNVEAASDGQAALESIRRNPPDLVLTDVMMPGLDGFALLRALRSDPSLRGIPVLLLSARAGEEATAEGLSAGADDYLVKPFTARELFARIAAKLAAAKASRGAVTQRANLYRAFMQAPFPVAIFRGPDHVIEIANDAILRSWGKDSNVVGRPWLDALPEMRNQPFPEQLDGVYRTGATFEGRAQLARMPTGPAGELQDAYFNYVYAALVDGRGVVDGVMVCAFDVTDQVLARRELEQASRAKDEFLATMGHELRTPLNAMLGWATMLKHDHRDRAKLERGLDVIERNAQTQTRLVSDLLDMSRIISGKLRLSVTRMQLSTVMHAAADVVRPAAEAKGVRLVVDVDPDLGSMMGDPDRLQQVVWNLLTNAVRFTPSKGRVTVRAERQGSNMTVVVQDTGAGIPAAHLPHIFERFRQVDSTTTRQHGGLGLGLAIVRHLSEAHGGSVVAESDGPGQGTTFTVSLPIRAVDTSVVEPGEAAPDAESRSEPEARSETEPWEEPTGTAMDNHEKNLPLRKVRALVVEDDEDSLELIRVVLEGAGAAVAVAPSAQEALHRARDPFDVIISDIGMPEMDGYTLMRRLRALASTAHVPAIALTAYARLEDAERALAAGYQQHLSKPVESTALITTVQRAVREAR